MWAAEQEGPGFESDLGPFWVKLFSPCLCKFALGTLFSPVTLNRKWQLAEDEWTLMCFTLLVSFLQEHLHFVTEICQDEVFILDHEGPVVSLAASTGMPDLVVEPTVGYVSRQTQQMQERQWCDFNKNFI